MNKEPLMYSVGEVDLIYNRHIPIEQQTKVFTSKEAYEVLIKFTDLFKIELKEQFFVLCMNSNGNINAFTKLFEGSVNGCAVDVKNILQAALITNSTAIIIAHNHPSGNLNPSDLDVMITQRVKNACEIMDIKMLDHIVFTTKGYYSFHEKNNH